MTTDTSLRVDIERKISAPPEAVFDAWLNPDMLAKFMTPMPDVVITEATCDPQVGGRFKVVMRVGDQDLPHSGTYKTIDRPNELAFTWESPMSTQEDSTVTLHFTPVNDGTKVTLRHHRFPSQDSRDNHEKGWGGILRALEAAL